MEKFPQKKNNLGSKVRTLAGAVGLSALSILGKAEGQPVGGEGIDASLKLKPGIEYTRSDLLSPESASLDELAASVLEKKINSTEEELSGLETRIELTEMEIELYQEELNYRSKNNGEREKFSSLTNELIIEELKLLKETIKSSEKEIESLNKLLDSMKITEVDIERKVEEIKKIITFYDLGRQWVLENIKDPYYGEKLQQEIKESYPELADEKISKMAIKVIFSRFQESSHDNFVVTGDMGKSSGSSSTLAFYSLLQNNVYFSAEDDTLSAILNAIHEYSHKATEARRFLTPNAINLFEQAFDSTGYIKKVLKVVLKENFNSLEDLDNMSEYLKDLVFRSIMDKIVYYSNPTEMYARKKVFDYDLERLGVKKYGEEFTEEHYKKVLELRDQNKLGGDSEEFLMIIKPDMIIKIMNEIADADFDEEKFKEIA